MLNICLKTNFFFHIQVLGKFPIIQHVPFGNLFQFKPCTKKKTFATSSTMKTPAMSLLEKLKKTEPPVPNVVNK